MTVREIEDLFDRVHQLANRAIDVARMAGEAEDQASNAKIEAERLARDLGELEGQIEALAVAEEPA